MENSSMAADVKKVMDEQKAHKTMCPCNVEKLAGIWAKSIISDLKAGKQDFTISEEESRTIEKILKSEVVCLFLAFLGWDMSREHQAKMTFTSLKANIETVPCSCKNKKLRASSQLRWRCYALYNVMHSRDEVRILLSDAWRTFLSWYTDRREGVNSLTEGFVYRQFLKLLERKELSVLIPALRAVDFILPEDAEHIEPIMECEVLKHLKDHMVHRETDVARLACRIIKRITIETDNYTEDLFREGVFDRLIDLLVSDECNIRIKAEAVHAISASISSQNDEQIRHMVGKGCIRPLCDLLRISSGDVEMFCLHALERILEVGETCETHEMMTYAQAIDEAGGWDTIDSLGYHSDFIIRNLSDHLLAYWTKEEDGYSTEE